MIAGYIKISPYLMYHRIRKLSFEEDGNKRDQKEFGYILIKEKMKIYFKQFGDLSHSWAQVSTSIAAKLLNNHDVSFCSTSGYEKFPEILKNNIKCSECTDNATRHPAKCKLDNDFDLGIAYTVPLNWSHYLMKAKIKFAIYNYDGTELPTGWSKHHKYVNLILPSSKFAYDTFIKAGIPKEKMIVVPHGYDDEFVGNKNIYPIKTDRKRKVLVNIQQNHYRKNLPGILDAWGKAFTKNDDVVMIAKIKTGGVKKGDVSWDDEYLKMKKRYKNHAPIITVNKFIDKMSDLYNACDIVFSASNIECFHLPSLYGLVTNKIVIASNWGGNVDFMNDENSLLINGKVERADPKIQYWANSNYGSCFVPDVNHCAELLQRSVNDYDCLLERFKPGMEKIRNEYTWGNVANKIIDLYKGI